MTGSTTSSASRLDEQQEDGAAYGPALRLWRRELAYAMKLEMGLLTVQAKELMR